MAQPNRLLSNRCEFCLWWRGFSPYLTCTSCMLFPVILLEHYQHCKERGKRPRRGILLLRRRRRGGGRKKKKTKKKMKKKTTTKTTQKKMKMMKERQENRGGRRDRRTDVGRRPGFCLKLQKLAHPPQIEPISLTELAPSGRCMRDFSLCSGM